MKWSPAVVLCLACLLVATRGLANDLAAEILWDDWGVPHVYAPERESAMYAFGWAQMSAHADAIAHLYAAARGEAAAHWGESAYADDALVHQLGIPQLARDALEAQSPADRAALEAFVRGQNDYATRHPEALPAESRRVLPFTARDVLAHVQRVVLTRFMFYADRGAIEQYAAAHSDSTAYRRARARASNGSNAYAIGPTRSASGHAMLVINPHLPWSGEYRQFEAQLAIGDRFVYGSALVGAPYVAMGFNADLGWTHTVNDFDALDTYELTLRGAGYVFDGAVRAFDVSAAESIAVRLPSGRIEQRPLVRRSSVHGPVVFHDASDGRALAVRFSPGALDQLPRRYWQLADARDAAAFEAIADRDRLGCFNTLYADRHGDILFRYEGVMPRRNAGDYASWQGIQSGVSSGNLWSDVYQRSALPRVENPPSGFLQNANDPPWHATLPPLDPSAYPPYIAPPVLDYRAQQSLRRVAEDPSITFDELVALKQSNRVEVADRFLPQLLAAVRMRRDLDRARAILAGWDHTLAPDARGAVLFLSWVEAMRELAGPDWAAEPWDPREPTATPRGLRDPELAGRALVRASAKLKRRYGRLDIAYGEVYRLRVGSHDFPASAGPSDYGVYSAAEFEPSSDGKQVAYAGDTFVAVIDFGTPLRAVGLLSYGNASQNGSPFVGDQLELFSRRELRPLWTTRAEVEEHLYARERLQAQR